MKRVIVLSAFVATNAMAIDFDSEWAKFQSDFERLKPIQVAKVNRQPIIKTVPTELVTIDDLPEDNTETNVVEQVDPKSPKRLGHKIEDPEVRDKVTKLYKKPDTVVYSLTLTE